MRINAGPVLMVPSIPGPQDLTVLSPAPQRVPKRDQTSKIPTQGHGDQTDLL